MPWVTLFAISSPTVYRLAGNVRAQQFEGPHVAAESSGAMMVLAVDIIGQRAAHRSRNAREELCGSETPSHALTGQLCAGDACLSANRSVGESLEAGEHTRVWNGQDADGQPVSSGVYYARLQSAGDTRIRSLTLVR